MSKPIANTPRVAMRTGAMIMRSVTLFLSGARSKTANQNKQKNKKRGKMTEKDNIQKCSPITLEIARRETLFNKNEIENLYKIYKKLVTINKSQQNQVKQGQNPSAGTGVMRKVSTVTEGIDRAVFRKILHNTFDILAENALMDRIFCVWDRQNHGLLTAENWLFGLSLYLKGSVSKQTEFCFAVYDLNADGYITKDEMFQLLKNSLIKHPQEEDPDEAVKEFVDIVMRKFDKDKDGKISLQDYQQTVAEEPLLLEAFGKCLPSECSKITFLTTLKSQLI